MKGNGITTKFQWEWQCFNKVND